MTIIVKKHDGKTFCPVCKKKLYLTRDIKSNKFAEDIYCSKCGFLFNPWHNSDFSSDDKKKKVKPWEARYLWE